MILSVRDVLAFEAMTGASLLAGAAGLDRPVRSATVLDAPDGAAWLKEEELAFTSTYPLIAISDRLDGFVASLAERGVSGLGVKLTRYMTSIPADVLEVADRLAFPIISLPEQVSWIELINPIVTNVINRQADRLRRSELIHGGFTETLIARSRLEDLAVLLEGLVDNPVVIDCPAEGITTWSSPPDAPRDATLLTRLRAPDAPRLVDPDHGVHQKGEGREALTFVPLAAELGGDARIAILAERRPFDEGDVDCLLHAQKAASIKLLQMKAELQIRRSRESDFVISLLDRQASAAMRKTLVRGGIEAGYRLPAPHVLVAATFEGIAKRQRAAVAARIQAVLGPDERVLVGFPERERVAILFNGDLAEDVPDRVVGALFADLRSRFPSLRLKAGVSRRLATLAELPEGFEQVEQVLRYDTGNDDPMLILRLEDVGFLRLFTSEAARTEARRFVADLLGPLLAHDRRRNANLVTTLQVFLQANGNHRLAASRLNLHHNSVRYRIDKIRKLTGRDVTARNLRLQYELALVLLPVIGEGN